ncbi:predicted protein [Postia placenta Mad-698-R]|nr:predicted protein [Postia placenta Mad-698-R]
MCTAAFKVLPSRPASSAIWERALQRHREDTAIDITSDAIAPELRSISNHDTLLLFAKERRGACNMDTQWDMRTSNALRHILGDIKLLLGIVTDATTLAVKKNFTYKAIISVIEQVPHVPEELRSSLSTTGIQECCVQYVATIIVLMGLALARKDILMKDDSVRMLLEELRSQVDDLRWEIGPFEVQYQHAWREIQDVARQANLDLHNLAAIDTTSDLVLRLNDYWRQAKIQSEDQRRLLATVQCLLDPHAVSLRDMVKPAHVASDLWKRILGLIVLCVEAAQGREKIYGIIGDVFSRLYTILQRVSPQSPTEELISMHTMSCRILLEIAKIILLSVGVIHGHQVVLSIQLWTGIEKSILLSREPLRSTICRIDGLVAKLLICISPSEIDSISKRLWRDAITMYMETTGNDIGSIETLQRIDSVDGLRSMLNTEIHRFTCEKQRYGAIHKVLDPISKCVNQILDVASDVAGSAAKEVGAAYDTILKLFTTLSNFLGRLELYTKEECSATIKIILTQILCQLLGVVGLATKVVKKNRISELHIQANMGDRPPLTTITVVFGKAIVGLHDMGLHDALTKLDQLIDSEARIVGANVLHVVRGTQKAILGVDVQVREVLQSVGQVQEHVTAVRSMLERGFFYVCIIPTAGTNSISAEQFNTAGMKGVTSNSVDLAPALLPPRPAVCVGRDKDVDTFRTFLLQQSHVLISGAGGVGKTTVALELLHHPEVACAFPTRCFVSCDAVTDLEAFRLKLADALGVPSEMRGQEPLTDILQRLSTGSSILCIDNFEALWEPPQSREEVEQDLAQLAGVDQVVLIVTMRGVERPGGILWAPTMSIQPLSVDDGLTMFAKISGASAGKHGEELVRTTDGLPLAISILAHLAQPEMETTESLWRRWQKTGPAIASRADGANQRLLNLGTSIELSLSSPRMRGDPSAHTVLAIIKDLPDGLPQSRKFLRKLQEYLPADIDLQRSLETLKRVALVHIDPRSGNHGRYRMLSPTREYCVRLSNLRLSDDITHAYRTFYAALMTRYRSNQTNSMIYAIVRPELLNVSSILSKWLNVSHPDANVIRAIHSHTLWSLYVGSPTPTLLQQVMKHPIDDEGLLAGCYQCLGHVQYYRDELQVAERNWNMALKAHDSTGNASEAANDYHNLGNLYQRTDRLDRAEAALTAALRLHREVQSSLGEAYDHQALGKLYVRTGQLDKAEAALTSALRLHKEVQSSLGEANDCRALGQLYTHTGQLDKAEDVLTSALRLHREVRDFLGEAMDYRALGSLYQRTSRPAEAEAALMSALRLHRKGHNSLGEADVHHVLGTLYMGAEVQDPLREGQEHKNMAMHPRTGRPVQAMNSFQNALHLYEQVGNKLGKANTLHSLGLIHLRGHRFQEAKDAFSQAYSLHKEVHEYVGARYDLEHLALIYVKLGRDKDAAGTLQIVIDHRRRTQRTHDVVNGLQFLGCVYMRMGRLDEAEASLKEAVQLLECMRNVDEKVRRVRKLLDKLRSLRSVRADLVADGEHATRTVVGCSNDQSMMTRMPWYTPTFSEASNCEEAVGIVY